MKINIEVKITYNKYILINIILKIKTKISLSNYYLKGRFGVIFLNIKIKLTYINQYII